MCDALQLAGIQLEAPHELEELVAQRRLLVHAERQRVVGPGAVHIHHDLGVGVAGDLVEQDRRDRFADLRQGAGGRGEVGFELDLVGDAQQLCSCSSTVRNSRRSW